MWNGAEAYLLPVPSWFYAEGAVLPKRELVAEGREQGVSKPHDDCEKLLLGHAVAVLSCLPMVKPG